MDPPSNTPGDKHREQNAARSAEAVAVYLAHLLWDAAVYLGESARDLIDAARGGLLRRSRTKFPERAGDLDAQMARLKEQKSRRWSSFETFSSGRRLQIRFAATVAAAKSLRYCSIWERLTVAGTALTSARVGLILSSAPMHARRENCRTSAR
jgi:hypothetical protein